MKIIKHAVQNWFDYPEEGVATIELSLTFKVDDFDSDIEQKIRTLFQAMIIQVEGL